MLCCLAPSSSSSHPHFYPNLHPILILIPIPFPSSLPSPFLSQSPSHPQTHLHPLPILTPSHPTPNPPANKSGKDIRAVWGREELFAQPALEEHQCAVPALSSRLLKTWCPPKGRKHGAVTPRDPEAEQEQGRDPAKTCTRQQRAAWQKEPRIPSPVSQVPQSECGFTRCLSPSNIKLLPRLYPPSGPHFCPFL